MSTFSTLVKHEFKTNIKHKTKSGVVNTIIELILTLSFLLVVALLSLKIVDTYVHIKFDKVFDVQTRLAEVLNVVNIVVIFFLTVYSIEKERKMILYSRDKQLLLRLPVKSSQIFLSKIYVIFILNYIISFIIYLTIGILCLILLKTSFIVILLSLLVSLIVTFISLFVSTILLVPYAKVINFISKQPLLSLLLLVLIVSGFIYLYLLFLNLLQVFIETGSIKHLFNEKFILTMISIFEHSYLINILATIVVRPTVNMVLIQLSLIILFGVLIYFISRFIFYKNLYLTSRITKIRKNKVVLVRKPVSAMVRKELISIYRNPRLLFLYFVIPVVLPILIVGTSNIFIKLVANATGIFINFEIVLLTSLIFISLINSFSSNLISKDGISFLQFKTYPINTNKILLSKILLNLILSTLSVIITFILCMTILKLKVYDSFIILGILLLVTISEILIGLKLDLNKSKLSNDILVNNVNTSNNQNRLIFIYLIIAFVFGILPLVISISDKLFKLNIGYLVYLLPSILVSITFVGSILYYRYKLNERFTMYGCKE